MDSFIAIDFETSNYKRTSICSVGMVFVENKKIGSIGLRIKQNGCYHGLSLNNHLDLTPFTFINPCGYANLHMTQVADFGVFLPTQTLCEQIADHFIKTL